MTLTQTHGAQARRSAQSEILAQQCPDVPELLPVFCEVFLLTFET